MRTHFSWRVTVPLFLALFALLTSLEDGQAGGVIFKDGFVIRGVVRRENQTMLDSSGQAIPIGKHFYMVDDFVRPTIFSPKHVQKIIDEEEAAGSDPMMLTLPFTRQVNGDLKSIEEIVEIKPFNDNWARDFRLIHRATRGKPETAEQRLMVLTPYYARVEARQLRWSSYYLTRELGPDTVRILLYGHPKLREVGGRPNLEKRLKIVDFIKQVGWYDVAEQELDSLLKDLPTQEKAIEKARDAVKARRNGQLLTDIELAHQAGRDGWARTRLAEFPKAAADPGELRRLRELSTEYEKAEAMLKDATRFLKALPERLSPTDPRKTWDEAVAAILEEVSLDSVGRLEAFVKFAQQDERERMAKKAPTLAAGDLLALGVSGWLLGSRAAEAKADVGLKLWRTRQFVLEYQKTANAGDRKNQLAAYEKKGAIALDEMAQLISLLPPVDPEEKLGEGILEREAPHQANIRKKTSYLLQLPPEYKHSRSYPVLLVLHNGGEKPKEMLERWRELAQRHGYLLAAPAWNNGFGQVYSYSAGEHAVVLDVLRDLQRHFNVDSDRVFLAGFGEGGAMAFDVGLSHPDLFAGVVPIAAVPRFFATSYAANSQHLPFYVVSGMLHANEGYKVLRKQFDSWTAQGQPALWVDYRGRAVEWFDGELPSVFDWMDRKRDLFKRSQGTPGTTEFQSYRATDNRFYWLTMNDIHARHVNDPRNPGFYRVTTAYVQGAIGTDNRIAIHARGCNSVTVWLARGMLDFDKPVTISVNGQERRRNWKVTQSLGVLLDDFWERGDRKRLFIAKEDVPL
jgi:predicted esterase